MRLQMPCTIDRLEGETAVLVDTDAVVISIDRKDLPPGSSEGDLVWYDGAWHLADSLSVQERRREDLRNRLRKLFGK